MKSSAEFGWGNNNNDGARKAIIAIFESSPCFHDAPVGVRVCVCGRLMEMFCITNT